MSGSDAQSNTLHERTLVGVQEVLERALNHVQGLEKMVVGRAIQILYPRVAQRIRGASEVDLRKVLKYLYDLLENVLQETKEQNNPETKLKYKRKIVRR